MLGSTCRVRKIKYNYVWHLGICRRNSEQQAGIKCRAKYNPTNYALGHNLSFYNYRFLRNQWLNGLGRIDERALENRVVSNNCKTIGNAVLDIIGSSQSYSYLACPDWSRYFPVCSASTAIQFQKQNQRQQEDYLAQPLFIDESPSTGSNQKWK
jgi:hypothetical protein